MDDLLDALELSRHFEKRFISFELGFSSHSHFTAAFRSELGTTPSRYRSQARPLAVS